MPSGRPDGGRRRLPFGGTCGIRGCDPKKVLVGAAVIIDPRRRMGGRGLAGDLRIDWPEVIRFKASSRTRSRIKEMTGSSRQGSRPSTGGPASWTTVRSRSARTCSIGDHLVIAVGAWPARLGIEGEDHITRSDQFLDLPELPRRITFVGGHIAFEFCHITTRGGAAVTISHQGARSLEHFDQDLVERLLKLTRDAGIDVRARTKVAGIEGASGNLRVTTTTDSGPEVFEADLPSTRLVEHPSWTISTCPRPVVRW